MTREFPVQIRRFSAQFMIVAAVVAFYLIFALLYEPKALSDLLSTGQGFYRLGDMSAFNLAISTAIVLVSTCLLRGLFLAFKNKVSRSLASYSLWCFIEVVITASFLSLYFCLIDKVNPQSGTYFSYLIQSVRAYLCVSVFPYLIVTLLYMLQDARTSEPMEDNTRIRFYDNRHLLRFATTVSSVLYIEAEENYIVVHYLENGVPKKIQIRNTMKSLEPMCETGSFVRVHRSYIVNPKHVKQLRKDPEGFFFADLDVEGPEIPVSKRYQKSLDAIL